jgi:hypothetical protein
MDSQVTPSRFRCGADHGAMSDQKSRHHAQQRTVFYRLLKVRRCSWYLRNGFSPLPLQAVLVTEMETERTKDFVGETVARRAVLQRRAAG